MYQKFTSTKLIVPSRVPHLPVVGMPHQTDYILVKKANERGLGDQLGAYRDHPIGGHRRPKGDP